MGRRNAFKLDVVTVRLVKDAPLYSEEEIHTPEDAINLIGEMLSDIDREVVCVLNLSSSGKPINCNIASMGALDYAIAHPREILKSAFLSNAAAFMLVHNHPSGKLAPSKEDVALTDRIKKVGDLVGIALLDHIIVGKSNEEYYSFKQKGTIKNARIVYATNPEYIDWENSMIAEGGRKR